MNRRIAAWLLLTVFLIVVGMCPPAIAPVTLAVAGASAILAALPGPVLLLAVALVWLRHKPTATTAGKARTR